MSKIGRRESDGEVVLLSGFILLERRSKVSQTAVIES